ncbi:MAG: hypothetical protein KC493_13085, partial [Bacteriovoracaceae bacterium]|nr:hypothetical protein [Bacteriovoracaceae bacterium]
MEFLKFNFTRTKALGLLLALSLFQVEAAKALSLEECGQYIDQDTFSKDYQLCTRATIAAEAGIDCVDCLFQQEEKSNPWVDVVGHIAGPLAFFGASYFGAKYAHKSQAAWASAYENGHAACTGQFDSYLNYSTERGLPGLTPDQAQGMMGSCNGFGMGGYAGMAGMSGNGYGGMGNPFSGAGYSGGMMGGMMGPNFGGGMYGGGGFGMGGGMG